MPDQSATRMVMPATYLKQTQCGCASAGCWESGSKPRKSASCLDCRIVLQRRLTSFFRSAGPVSINDGLDLLLKKPELLADNGEGTRLLGKAEMRSVTCGTEACHCQRQLI